MNIQPGSIVTGPTLPEPVEVLVTMPMGSALKIIGRGRNTGMTYDPVLTPEQIARLQVSAEREPFDGDARLFRLGIEAQRLGLAYEYDPFFSLSIARVDPLPHQLEAVYGYFRREKILSAPEKYRREQIARRMPDDFDDLDEEDQQEIIAQLEDEVLSYDPAVLQEEIAQLNRLVEHAKQIEGRDVQSKLKKLRSVLTEQGIFADPQMKLLVFTEHKDTLDYLAADGKDGRPLGKLREWGLTITQIHGGMKIGDRDTPGSRICAEREFRDSAQVLVATTSPTGTTPLSRSTWRQAGR